MSDDKIVNLAQTMTLERRRSIRMCRHRSLVIDQDRRLLECKGCGRMIEPFDYIWQHAQGQQRIVWELESAKSQVERLTAEVEELKRQKRNMAAQVRRAKEKAK